MNNQPPRRLEEDGIPWMLSRRINRQIEARLGLPWTYRHDIAAARQLFKAGAIDSEHLNNLVEKAKSRRPKREQGFRLW